MALTTVEYTYSGQASFAIPFSLGILNRAYVTIQINNQVDGSGDPLYYTNFTWTSDSEVVINGLTNGDIIKIARTIPSNLLLSDYTAGSNITRDNLNIANKQLIMLIHEVLDKNVTQQTKLDTIESGATADQTAAEIKTAYESNANTNAFTDADESKLDGIEAGADVTDTANVTAAGAVMDSEVTDLAGIKSVTVSTLQVKPAEGAFVDGDKTKLNSIETNADVTDTTNVVAALTAGTNITIASDGTIASTAAGGGGGVSDIVEDLTPQLGGDLDLNNQDITGTGNISITGTVNGRTLGTDGTKLDAIEALADVTDTDNVVAALTAGTNVTIAADGTISSTDTNTTYTVGDGGLTTNDFTNADHSKLDGIEAGATADQTKADIDALNIDADTLDGQHGSYYTSYADTAVAGIVDSAPGTLDTLNELAQALGDDPNFATTTATNLSQKLPKAGGTMTGDILFNDGVKAKYGTSSDLQIYHDGSNSIIDDSGTGNLYIRSNDVLIDKYTGERMIRAIADGAVTLYYDNAEKLATTSTGIDVTGAIDVATSGASNTSKGIAISTSGTNFESDGGIISIDHAASGAVTGGYFSKYSAGGTLRHSVKGDGKGYFAGGIDVTGATNTTGTSNTRQWSVGTAGAKMGVYALDNSTMYMRVESGSSTNFQFGTYDNIPIYTITNNTVRTALLGNGNFGVGHTSPVAKMAILGTSNSTITEANSNLCVEGSGGNGMLFGTLNTTGFKSYIQSGYVSSLSAATYDLLLNPEGGNVGVGLSAPTAKMHLFTDGIDQSVFSAQTDLGANNRILTLKSPVSDSGSAPYRWQTSNSIQWEIDTTETKSMLLNSAGNLGVGTYSPTHKLSVAGELNTTGSIYLNSGTADSPQVVWRSSGYGDQYIDNFQGNLRVVNSGAQQVTIKQGGNVGIGTSAPTAKLSVAGNVNVSNALNVGGASAAGSGFIESTVVGPSRALQTVGNVNTTQTHIGFENLYGEIGRIDVSAFSVSYVTSSDYRLKTDIQPMQGSIDRVKALKPVNFEWKEDGTRVDGFLAHEAQEIVPEAVSGEKDATKTNKDGVEVPDYQGIDQSKLVPLLTSALQEALAKIDDLELRMANLEN